MLETRMAAWGTSPRLVSPRADDADAAYEHEKKNVEANQDTNWKAYRFDVDVWSEDRDEITAEIDRQLDELCAAATTR